MIAIDLFAGSGGFTTGEEMAGANAVCPPVARDLIAALP